jgi:predicted nucleic acid-binding Zn ribbon protein
MAEGGPARVGSVLQKVLEKHGVDRQIERLGVLELWPDIVGEQLAEVTRAKGVDDAALFVEVRSSAWLSELSTMKHEFLERVNARLGDAAIERIVFVQAES